MEIFVLRSSYLIDSFSEVSGRVELVVDRLGSGVLFRHGIGIRRKNVGCHGSNLVPLLRRQGLEDRFRRDLRSVLNNVKNASAIQICQHGDVVMTSPKALFINPEMWNRRCLAPLQAPLVRVPSVL